MLDRGAVRGEPTGISHSKKILSQKKNKVYLTMFLCNIINAIYVNTIFVKLKIYK